LPFGLFDYTSSGRGVAKNERRKKPFFRFFEIFGRKFWKLVQLNLIYVLFCIPVVTFGPATAAMTKVCRKFYLEQPIFLFDEFFTAFKKNFKQSVIVGIFDVIIVVLWVFSFFFYNVSLDAGAGTEQLVLFALLCGSGIIAWMIHQYIYVQIVTLTLPLNKIIKNSLIFVFIGLKNNIIALLAHALLIVLIVFIVPTPYSLIILPFAPASWMCLISVFSSYPMITKIIIDPYYASIGEKNPETPDYTPVQENEAPVFEDMGGKEEVIKKKPKSGKGKVIK
jgi:uncharacterized membrane protein YesL